MTAYTIIYTSIYQGTRSGQIDERLSNAIVTVVLES